jgi:hypothetical protein
MNRNFLHKLFTLLEARPVIGGLEVSDSGLRFVASGTSFATSVRLEPGVFSKGKIEDEVAFLAALDLLRSQILGRKEKTAARINVVVTLSSTHVYSQVFALPFLEGESLDKAVELNLKMSLPGGASESYSGWQILSHKGEGGKIEILAAFLDKSLADDLTALLRKANFSVLAIEARALSLARLVKSAAAGFDPKVPLIMISADTSGLDVMIVRDGNLQFDYFNTWADLAGGEISMTIETFQAIIVRSVAQIMNFYGSHWKEPIGEMLVAATGMKDEIIDTVKKNFGVNVREFVPLVSPPLTSDWFAALGGALRGRLPRKEDVELSLLGIDAREEFRREQIDHFLSFWRLLTPLALSVLLLAFAGSWFFLDTVAKNIENQSVFNISAAEEGEIKSLRTQAEDFNLSVAYLAAANAVASPKAPVLAKIYEITDRRGITISQLKVGGRTEPIFMSGSAATDTAILDFKKELDITTGIKDVKLLITDIHQEGDHYTFSINFTVSS